MARPIPQSKVDRIVRHAAKGVGPTEIARRVSVSLNTAQKYARASTDRPQIQASTPFGPGPQGPAHTPPNAWNTDQPPPPPADITFRPGYHDHTYRSFAPPLAFDGWTVERIRNAIALHDLGIFLESSALCVACTRFGPVYSALEQAIAPVLALPRQVLGGTRGLSKLLAAEVTAQLAPRDGLLPSPFFPPTLWGSTAIERRMMGFAVWQHVYGDPDPLTGVRPVYTRRWPTWAVTYYPSRRTFVANTDSGPVDIVNGDGKFTLVADSDEPHHDGAARALGLEVLAGVLADQALASYIDRYGNPKLFGTMPEGVAVRSAEGIAFFEAMQTLLGPNGVGALPFGSQLEWASLSAAQSSVFKDAAEKVERRVFSIILGTDGTASAATGGVYLSPHSFDVSRSTIARMLTSIVRAANLGHVAPWLEMNYAAAIEECRGWVEPVLSIPLPDPNADERRKAYAARAKERTEIITAEKAAGLDVTQERVDQLSIELGLQPIALVVLTGGTEIARPGHGDGAMVIESPVPDDAPDIEEPADPSEGGGDFEEDAA